MRGTYGTVLVAMAAVLVCSADPYYEYYLSRSQQSPKFYDQNVYQSRLLHPSYQAVASSRSKYAELPSDSLRYGGFRRPSALSARDRLRSDPAYFSVGLNPDYPQPSYDSDRSYRVYDQVHTPAELPFVFDPHFPFRARIERTTTSPKPDNHFDEIGEQLLRFLDAETGISTKLFIKSKISIMHLELIALLEALSYIASIDYDKFVIFTDCKSAILHLARCVHGSSFRGIPIAYTLLNNINRLTNTNKSIKIQWIPSHVGLVENEEVDKLAKEATEDGELFNCLPIYTELIPFIKRIAFDNWSEYFDERSLTKGIWYKTIQPSLLRFPWFLRTDMGRNDIVTAARLRSGHVPLNMFAYMMGKVESLPCDRCGAIEDVYHVLMECAWNEGLRRQLFPCDHIFWQMGGCNSVLAEPDSSDARGLYDVYRAALKERAQFI